MTGRTRQCLIPACSFIPCAKREINNDDDGNDFRLDRQLVEQGSAWYIYTLFMT